MDTLRIVQYDIHGKNPVNKFDRSEIKIKDKTCPWVIPDGSPFFGDYPAVGELPLTVVYDERGAELKRDRDYWLEEEFIPLVEVTGRPIVCFIRLSDEVREINSLIRVSYQSVGAYFVPRNSMEEWLEQMKKGIVPVPWTKVFGVPPSLPPEWHSHSAKTEIGDWFELTWFYTYVAGIVSTRDPNVAVELETAIRQAFDQLYLLRNQQQLALKQHDMDYNVPHGTTAASVNMGNHPNYPTATVAQQRAGDSNVLLSTPQGVQETLKDFLPDTAGAMRSGILPVSKFSNSGYIPPTITGSFEGLGSKSECMGICLEEDGRCVVIQNHYDGRTEGLYFSVLSGLRKPYDPKNPYRFEYTAFKYEPPVLKNIGVNPNAIVMGSGNDIIMVGKANVTGAPGADRWFIALTNNSFDPSGHRYIETNMSNVFAECGNPTNEGLWYGGFFYHARMSIDLMGQWVLLTVDAVPDRADYYGPQGKIVRFRIPKSALINGTPATWQVMTVSYPDYDGVQYNNVKSWNFAQKQGTDSAMTRWGRYVFDQVLPPPKGVGTLGRRLISLYGLKPGTTNIYYYNFLSYTFIAWSPPNRPYNNGMTMTNIVYEFNIDTGAMTLVYKQPQLNVNFNTANTDVVFADRDIWMMWYGALVRYLYPATIITPNGEAVTTLTGNRQEGSVLNSVLEYMKFALRDGTPITSKAQFLAGSLGKDRIQVAVDLTYSRNIQTPIPIGLTSRWLAYETQGENFMTSPTIIKDLAVGLQEPQIVCRNISGPYAVRATLPNQQLAPVYSRPLTNNVYATNMSFREGVVSISGPSNELDSRGLECGNMGLSVCGWSSLNPPGYPDERTFPGTLFRASNEQGAVQTFPKTYNRVFDPAAQVMNYAPTAFYGLSQGVRDKIRSLIPAAQQGPVWGYSLFVLNAETGGMFSGLNKALLYIKYPAAANGSSPNWDAQHLLVTPIVEAPNANHPDCHLIVDFQIVGRAVTVAQHRYAIAANLGAWRDVSNRPFLHIYRTGNIAQCVFSSGLAVVSGTIYNDNNVFNVDLNTGAFSQLGTSEVSWENGDLAAVFPRVGRTAYGIDAPDTYLALITNAPMMGVTNNTSGGAARIFPVARAGGGTDYYASISGYPETGWAIFFLEEVELMVNGTMHRMPIGSVDLRDFDPAPQNKTFWIYATIVDEKGRYIISDTKLRHSGKMIHAATVTTGPNQILLIDRRQPFMIGDLELSYSRLGGSIPVSSGFPQEDGNFTFLRAAELLP